MARPRPRPRDRLRRGTGRRAARPLPGGGTGRPSISLSAALAGAGSPAESCRRRKHCHPCRRSRLAASGPSAETTGTREMPLAKRRLSHAAWRPGLELPGPCPTQASSPTLRRMRRVSARKENRAREQLRRTLRKPCAEGVGVGLSLPPRPSRLGGLEQAPAGLAASSGHRHLLLTRVFVFLSVK